MSRRNRKVTSESLDISAAQKHISKAYITKPKNSYYTNYDINRFCCFLGNKYLYWHSGSVYISSPSRVVNTIVQMTVDGQLFYHLGITLYETLLSFALVNLIGLLVAVILVE